MKILLNKLAIVLIASCSVSFWLYAERPSVISLNSPDSTLDKRDKFSDWTDEELNRYEDSIKSVLYPVPIVESIDPDSLNMPLPKRELGKLLSNNYVPSSYSIDKTKAVGEISVISGTSPDGAKTYCVPIEAYPGINGLTPNISLNYNSHQLNSEVCIGWSIGGLSKIVRRGKNQYYDSKTEGVALDNNDSFYLDGMRLIKLYTTTESVVYQSEQGNVKAKGYVSGNTMKYFEVFYPDGTKGTFETSSNTSNKITYPITSLKDLHGNIITYTYVNGIDRRYISQITYNGASISFTYASSKGDSFFSFSGGLKETTDRQLNSISCSLGSTVLSQYILSYESVGKFKTLKKIVLKAGGLEVNPLVFYYGDGANEKSYSTNVTQLTEWYSSTDRNAIKVCKGKFDYVSGTDGIIALPNNNPYWRHYRHKTTFRRSQKRFDNLYKGDEKIFLYAGLGNSMASPAPQLITGAGFVDILCADLLGTQEEQVIKINNTVVNDMDRVTFTVYSSSLYSGLSLMYTRTFDFPTMIKDNDGGRSINPKFYYTGDFNGDGKMEILAVSTHEPFGHTDKPTKCYLFDLVGNSILYQGQPFQFIMEFVGSQQSDPRAASNNSNKLMVMDYNGDGKTDICHINDSGTTFYSFFGSGSSMSLVAEPVCSSVTKTGLKDREVIIGDFNGDGCDDILVSPQYGVTPVDELWKMYNSKGDGSLLYSSFRSTNNAVDNLCFLSQDIDGDGIPDVIRYDDNAFETLLTTRNCHSQTLSTTFGYQQSVLIPTNVTSRNSFTQLIALKNGKATKYSYTTDAHAQSLLTGMVNSLGVVERNEYANIDYDGASTGFYTRGYGAVYPYVNVQEPFMVLKRTETYVNNSLVDYKQYTYGNAILHKQGLGFRGFERITCHDQRGFESERMYDPTNMGILKSEKDRHCKTDYSYDVKINANKTSYANLSKKETSNLADGSTYTISYSYDTYGYPIKEIVSYDDGSETENQYMYSSNATVGDGYNLGFMTKKTTFEKKGNESIGNTISVSSHSKRLPLTVTFSKGGNVFETIKNTYDANGNRLTKSIKPYSASVFQDSTFVYDSYGRIIKETDCLGLTTQYTYDTFGRVSTVTSPSNIKTSRVYDGLGRMLSVTYPDQSKDINTYSWNSTIENGLYAVKKQTRGKPETIVIYDPAKREIRKSEIRFDGSYVHMDRNYDSAGRIWKISLPFKGSTPSLWNTYAYDAFDRIVSISEASGKKTINVYSGKNITTTENGISTVKKYDARGNLIEISDPAGMVEYQLAADGLPVCITAPGDAKTTFKYDTYRRRISITDPSAGTTDFQYDSSGNILKETNANNLSVTYVYDANNRLLKKVMPEFTISYTYDQYNRVTETSFSTGQKRTVSYDNLNRISWIDESCSDGKWYKKIYTYNSTGQVTGIRHYESKGEILYENFVYANGHLCEGKINSTMSVLKLVKENEFGLPTEVKTGKVTRYYTYDKFGTPTGRKCQSGSTVYQNSTYVFNAASGNLEKRNDLKRSFIEQFEYDDLNRLVSSHNQTTSFDNQGNLLTKSDVGAFGYDHVSKPYALTSVETNSDAIPIARQDITYTSFNRPLSISENGKTAKFEYGADMSRIKMTVTDNGKQLLSRYYLANSYELDHSDNGDVDRVYLFGDYYKAPIVYERKNSSGTVYLLVRDYLGSIVSVIDNGSDKYQELSYDAWGRLRNPATKEHYSYGKEPSLWFGRGYTGHEHLPYFGLINMNARLYDPAVGRFLSSDPYVQMPESTQGFNRYSYCINNPLRYNDPDGKFFLFTLFNAVTDLWGNLFKHGFNFSRYSWKRTANSWKIETGMFRGNFGQICNKWTFGIVNSFVGMRISEIYNTFGKVDGVTYLEGMAALSGATPGSSAMTIGHYSLGPKGYVADWRDHLFVHEYGHYIQTQYMGPLFFPVVALPSLASASFTSSWSGMEHKERWFEVNASKLGARYFDRRYGSGKANYKKDDPNYFDIGSFIRLSDKSSRARSPYINPRTGSNDNYSFPISGSRLIIWDFIL